MKLTLSDPKYLKESVSIISELVTEARFKLTPDAIELVAMDPANVAMVIFKLLSSSFTEYKVDKEVKIALNLNNLKQVLRRSSASDIVTLELEENKFKITLRSTTMLSEAVEDVSIVAESVKLSADKKRFMISAEGDLSKANIEIPEDDNTVITKEGDDVLSAKYSIEYLKKMIQGSKLSPTVFIRFNSDYPLKLEFKVMDKLMLSFILAPRVDND